jgi:hypothetical protein
MDRPTGDPTALISTTQTVKAMEPSRHIVNNPGSKGCIAHPYSNKQKALQKHLLGTRSNNKTEFKN